ncbi:MAG: phenylalanine--tRNA ligase subunit beta [Candidatus Pacearchaeota archaeon]
MTVVSVRKSEVKKIIGNKSDSDIDNILSMMGTAVESMGENIVDVEVAPNRPDMLSESGVLMALKSFSGKKKFLQKFKLNKPRKNYDVLVDPNVKDVRPYTVCAIIHNLKFDDDKIREVMDIQEKLHNTIGRKRKKLAIGIYPLEKIKLPIIYKALAPEEIRFRPLEFPKELNGKQILKQHPAGKDYGFLLEGKDKFPVFIDSNSEILSMPPIINSDKTGKITHETKDIFIEVSGFDLEIQKKTLNILTNIFGSFEGSIFQMNVHYGSKLERTPDFSPLKMDLNIENVNKLLGLSLTEKDVELLLGKMGIEYKRGSALIPSYRVDVFHEVDLIEDIAIAYGYENFVPEIPEVSTIGEISKEEIIKGKIREVLIGLGLLETSSYHLTTKEHQIDKLYLNNEKYFEVKNSKTEYALLRKDLSHYMLKILGENVDVEYPQEIFQVGSVFSGSSGIEEKENLSIVIAPGNFTRMKQIFEYLARMLNIGVKILKTDKYEPYFINGRVAEVIVNGKSSGYFGEVHPKILKNFRIKMPVSLLEINLDEILKIN